VQIGVVSDTHDNLGVAQAAVDRFVAADVDMVVHCGDVISPFTVRLFDTDEFEFYAARGNNDGEWALQSLVEEFGAYLGEMGELELETAHVAVYHGTSEAVVGALVDSGTYDYVLRGHTHEQVHERRNGTVHINPGGIPLDPSGGNPPAAVVLDTAADEVRFHDLG
jgi:putative phosphoesterase